MIPTQGPRAPFPGAPAYHTAPNAALLIDFDNVTMGIRSDLGKELKALLNSDVIRGKVAVQRAYADWRRYPQYIVPLAESSIDLIFAPAYGSSKKNATDLRMAIDAIELVFTRPEIGTFILLTGDSDFSSCVLKLKEYGKYVIGVGMRESSSDLLIQNCDEYYSYHALSGLTRAGEEEESKEDPWTLVKRAAQQMVARGDVMRTDRLKQVMLELDPAFDEGKIGYSKFSRFVHDAADKGLLRLRRGENGQHEIIPEGVEAGVPAAGAEDGGSARRGRRGRDERERRDERRESRPARTEAPRPRVLEEEPAAPVESVAEAAPPAAEPAPEPRAPETTAAVAAPTVAVDGIDAAYGLLQEAVRRLAPSGGKAVRDGDVKREMLRLAPGFDEEALGFSKFTRFLRQAHDAEVIDLNRVGAGNYEVSLPAGGKRLPPPKAQPAASETAAAPAAEGPTEAAPAAKPETAPAPEPQAERAAAPASAPAVGGLRGRRGGRGAAAAGPPPLLPGQVVAPMASEPAAASAAAAQPAAEKPAAEEGAGAVEESSKSRSRRGRRGGRGRGRTAAAETEAEAPAAPEPTAEPVPVPEAAAAEAPASEVPAETARARRGRGRGRGRTAAAEEAPPILPGQTVEPPAAKAAEQAPAKGTAPKPRGRAPRARAEQPKEASFSAASLGLPHDREAIEAYLTNSYRGVGKKTADQLLDAFGADVFRVMEAEPARVKEVLGRRADALLDQWRVDHGRRAGPAAPAAERTPAAPDAPVAEEAPKPRTRRGGRGRGRKKQEAPAG